MGQTRKQHRESDPDPEPVGKRSPEESPSAEAGLRILASIICQARLRQTSNKPKDEVQP